MDEAPATRGRDWLRQYPPLAGLLAACLLTAVVLPSSLNTLRNDPSATAEYAPVSSSDEDAPPGGNAGAYGLATSAGIGSSEADGETTSTTLNRGGGTGGRPSRYRCVGTPPRQTEDPLAPPCSGFFEGDNGGATWRGVSGGEITVLAYVGYADYIFTTSSRPGERPPIGTYDDLDRAARDDEFIYTRMLRHLLRYFNSRYQLYGRRVHMIVYYGSSGGTQDPEQMRSEAAENFAQVEPFAVMPWGPGAGRPYVEAVARRGAMAFSSGELRSDEFYRNYAGLLWGYRPTTERVAALFTSYVCSNIVRKPVSFSGEDQYTGGPRKLGLLGVREPPAMKELTDEVRKGVTACGGSFAVERDLQDVRFSGPEPTQEARENVAAFAGADVTTIIAPAVDNPGNHTTAAGQIDYRPEWAVGSVPGPAQSQDNSVWSHSTLVTSNVRVDDPRGTYCHQAFAEAEPSAPAPDVDLMCRDGVYDDMRQLFTGLQVAGPRLSPSSVERGFRAIPAHRSSTPYVPACYYDPDDWSCVKDAMAVYWDASANVTGCYRMIEGGRRYRVREWPEGNVVERRRPDDPCNRG